MSPTEQWIEPLKVTMEPGDRSDRRAPLAALPKPGAYTRRPPLAVSLSAISRFGHLWQRQPLWLAALMVMAAVGAAHPAAAQITQPAAFSAKDTLDVTQDLSAKAQVVLDGVVWPGGRFQVQYATGEGRDYDGVLRFPSPRPEGELHPDTVRLFWYAARGEDGTLSQAPAVLLVHSLHPRMPVTTALARGFAHHDVHAFLVHLPGYGQRRDRQGQPEGVTCLLRGRQAVADTRRARDAIAALPQIKPGPIAIVGTSLGGFVTSVAASLDSAFDPVLLLFTGGDGYAVLQEGLHDAQNFRLALKRAGYDGEDLRELVDRVEPLHVAHRLDRERTWLFSARGDLVVPRRSSMALLDRIGLDSSHHVWVDGNHYTAALTLPGVLQFMVKTIRSEP